MEKKRVKIIYHPNSDLIGLSGIVIKKIVSCDGVSLYKVSVNGRVVKDYATEDCLEFV